MRPTYRLNSLWPVAGLSVASMVLGASAAGLIVSSHLRLENASLAADLRGAQRQVVVMRDMLKANSPDLERHARPLAGEAPSTTGSASRAVAPASAPAAPLAAAAAVASAQPAAEPGPRKKAEPTATNRSPPAKDAAKPAEKRSPEKSQGGRPDGTKAEPGARSVTTFATAASPLAATPKAEGRPDTVTRTPEPAAVAAPPASPTAVAAPAKTPRFEAVSAAKAGVAKVEPGAVVMQSGKRIRVGETFSSGERLISADPETGQIITDQRNLLIL